MGGSNEPESSSVTKANTEKQNKHQGFPGDQQTVSPLSSSSNILRKVLADHKKYNKSNYSNTINDETCFLPRHLSSFIHYAMLTQSILTLLSK